MKYEELLKDLRGRPGLGRHQLAIRAMEPGDVYGPVVGNHLYTLRAAEGLDAREYRIVKREGKAYVVRLKPEDIK